MYSVISYVVFCHLKTEGNRKHNCNLLVSYYVIEQVCKLFKIIVLVLYIILGYVRSLNLNRPRPIMIGPHDFTLTLLRDTSAMLFSF